MDFNKTLVYADFHIKYAVLEPEVNPIGSSRRLTVVFVHGTPWSSVVFQPLAKALLATNQYRVLLYDLPGYGRSQHYTGRPRKDDELFEGNTSVKAQAAALAALLEHLQLDGESGASAPAVVAHDIAGAIALRTHLIHNVAFHSLMLWDTNAVLPWGDGFYKLVRKQPAAFLQMPPHVFEAAVRATIRSACHTPAKLAAGWEDALAAPWLGSEERRRSFVRQIAQADDGDVKEMLDGKMYGQVKCPVRILWGESDTWIPREKMEELTRSLPVGCVTSSNGKAEVTVVLEAGHLLMVDQPERMAVEVLSWLNGLNKQ